MGVLLEGVSAVVPVAEVPGVPVDSDGEVELSVAVTDPVVSPLVNENCDDPEVLETVVSPDEVVCEVSLEIV